MNKAEFLEELQDVFETEEELKPEMLLEDFEYDSLAILGVMSAFEICGIDIPLDDYQDFKTIGDLIEIYESKK